VIKRKVIQGVRPNTFELCEENAISMTESGAYSMTGFQNLQHTAGMLLLVLRLKD
jgi:hypothetical protein